MMNGPAIFLAVPLLFGLEPASQQQDHRQVWNRLFADGRAIGWNANEFLAAVVKNRVPGKALDIGMGQGRNSLFLAEQDWTVTGIDIADEGIRIAREEADRRSLKLDAVIADADVFDYGVERWDLVVGMYMHDVLTRNAEKIVKSIKPGGILVVEGFHRDLKRESIDTGEYFGFRTNELLRVFAELRILHYEDRIDKADWLQQELPIVRLLARKEPAKAE